MTEWLVMSAVAFGAQSLLYGIRTASALAIAVPVVAVVALVLIRGVLG